MTTRSKAEPLWLELATAAAFCAFLFFYGLAAFGLVGADEPRYAQIAREMLARHDWVTPVLNGVPWLEKPVLYYWSAMLSYKVFGVSDWAARLPSAILATVMAFAAYAFMRRFRPGSQLDTAIIVASIAGTIGFARAASTDMPLTATLTIALLGWYAWYETRSKLLLSISYVFFALATLAKGPVAPFLAAIIVIPFLFLRRDYTALRQTFWIPGLLIYFVVALPWYVAVQRANPQFFHFFILEQNLARFGTNKYYHPHPFWYFVPVALLGLFPWVVFVVCAFIKAVRESVARRSSFKLFFALWATIPVIFFSFSQSKLPGYILPALPAFAILAAEHIWRRIEEQNEPPLWLTLLHSIVATALLSASLLTIFFVMKIPVSAHATVTVGIVGAAVFIGMLVSMYAKGLRTARFATMVPLVIAIAFVIKVASPAIDLKDSERPVAEKLAQIAKPTLPVAVAYVPRTVEYGLNFYRDQPISNYERGEIPGGDHIVIGRPGAEEVIASMAKGRQVLPMGSFSPQDLEFYLVTSK